MPSISRHPLLASLIGLGLFATPALAQKAGRGAPPPPAQPLAPDVWNFSVTKGNIDVDGFNESMLIFQRNANRVAIGAPDNWVYAGNAAELAFINPKIPGARISIRKSSLPVPKEFDKAWGDALRETLVGSLPKDSKNGKVTDLIGQPISTNGWKTYEGRCAFNLAGDRYVWSYVFIKLHDLSMLEGIVVCREPDFTAARGALFSILPTFQSLGKPKVPAAPGTPAPPGTRPAGT